MAIEALPVDCISHIISFTSTEDASRLAAVCKTFQTAADSDDVWERFLPSDHPEIVSRADERLDFSSRKELFFCLCSSILIDNGRKCFSLEPTRCKKRFILSARELQITCGESPVNWEWIPTPGSRFPETAVLRDVCSLEIMGKIDRRMLSEKTNYAAIIIFRITDDSYGLDFPQQAFIRTGDLMSERTVYLQPEEPHFPRLLLPVNPNSKFAWIADERVGIPLKRGNGWMEIEMGEFFCDEGDDMDVEFSLTEVRGWHWKRGLVVEGVEVRPANWAPCTIV
ncbi:F-box protein VBF-like [Wolffia australiana]